MIGIIEYKAGNLASVSNALARLKADHTITDSPGKLDECDGILLPGVGHAASAMEDLKARKLDIWLKKTDKPVLGICLGMQLLYESTAEGEVETLGLIPGRLQKFNPGPVKVPHMGWNRFSKQKDHPILDSIRPDEYFYYVHSFYAPVNKYSIACCAYGNEFSAATARDNFTGVQFHPEKSGKTGAKLLRNFLEIVALQ